MSLIAHPEEYNKYVISWEFQIFGYRMSAYSNLRITADEENKEK